MDKKAINANQNVRLHACVEGFVQGVGFRFYCMQNAYALGITGWVRNRHNGEVEVIAEGDRQTLEKYIDVLSKGPSMAQIQKVRIEWEEWSGDFSSFDAKPTV